MFTRKVLISLVFVIAFAFVLGGCSNLFGPDSSDDGGVEETYDVRFEVTGTDIDVASVDWRIGDDEGIEPARNLSWEKEGTCGENAHLYIAAGSYEEGELTATIYINGEEEATATGQWNSDNTETAVYVETRTPR